MPKDEKKTQHFREADYRIPGVGDVYVMRPGDGLPRVRNDGSHVFTLEGSCYEPIEKRPKRKNGE